MSRLRAERERVVLNWSEWEAAALRRAKTKEAEATQLRLRREEDTQRLADVILERITDACVQYHDDWVAVGNFAGLKLPHAVIWPDHPPSPGWDGWKDESIASGRSRVEKRLTNDGFVVTRLRWFEDVELSVPRLSLTGEKA